MEDYKLNYEKLSSKTRPYFDRNWKDTYYEWVKALKPSKINLGVRTSNHCESMFSHIKRFAMVKTNILNLIHDLKDFYFFKQKNINDDWKINNIYYKKKNVNSDKEENIFEEYKFVPTEYALEYLRAIYIESKKFENLN